MARRGGMAQQLACCCFLVALALACGVALGAGSAPRLTGPPNKIPKMELQKFTFKKSGNGKRLYTISCNKEKGQKKACVMSCPAKCPNECLAYCKYCVSFCRKSVKSSLPKLIDSFYLDMHVFRHVLLSKYMCI
jgi:hypothetical protein